MQNTDKRVIFVNPYEGDKALVGTTDILVEGDPADVAVEQAEIDCLLGVVNRYFEVTLSTDDVPARFSGVRPLYDDDAEDPSAVTRDHVFDVEPETPTAGRAPRLSVFGGKITTCRKLAEHALDKLGPFFAQMAKPWTASAPSPGGDLPDADFDRFLAGLQHRYPWLPRDLAHHYARLYGSRTAFVLDGTGSLADLGRHFGGLLHECEVDYLRRVEWAETAADILERRTKHDLHLEPAERRAFEAWCDGRAIEPAGA